jgi:Alginate export
MRVINKIVPILPCLALGLSWGAAPAESPYSTPQPPFFGQVRTRTEFDSKDVRDTLANHPYLNTQIRTRLGFTAVPSEKVEIKVEMQDTRFMGSETPAVATAGNPATASIANSKGVDLLQGYFAIEEGNFKTAIGRQKMTLGAGRFLSTLEWSPTSRSFDGWSFNYKIGEVGNLTGISFLVRDTSATLKEDRLLLSGLHYSHQITPDIVAEGYGFYDQSRLKTIYAGDTSMNYDLEYLGQRVAGKVGIFSFEEEFIYQMGELRGTKSDFDNAAFQLATRLGIVMGNYKANVGLDMMSGDDDSNDKKIHTYRANYYFAHALYGWMDYFVNNPKYGVTDIRLDGDFGFLVGPTGNPRVTIKPQYHFFMPQSAPAGQDDPYGQELNLEAHIGWYPKSNIVLGAALFIPGKSAYKLQPAARITNSAYSDQNGWFLYFMPAFNF